MIYVAFGVGAVISGAVLAVTYALCRLWMCDEVDA